MCQLVSRAAPHGSGPTGPRHRTAQGAQGCCPDGPNPQAGPRAHLPTEPPRLPHGKAGRWGGKPESDQPAAESRGLALAVGTSRLDVRQPKGATGSQAPREPAGGPPGPVTWGAGGGGADTSITDPGTPACRGGKGGRGTGTEHRLSGRHVAGLGTGGPVSVPILRPVRHSPGLPRRNAPEAPGTAGSPPLLPGEAQAGAGAGARVTGHPEGIGALGLPPHPLGRCQPPAPGIAGRLFWSRCSFRLRTVFSNHQEPGRPGWGLSVDL